MEVISPTPWCEEVIGDAIDIGSKAFCTMRKLRFLQINCRSLVRFPKGLKFLPENIRYLEWRNYPFNCLPPNYDPWKLVQLDMFSSNLEQLIWTKVLYNPHASFSFTIP